MATAKRRKGSKSVPNKNTQKERNTAKRQLTAVVLFALGIFIAAVVFISGENFWNMIRYFLFGVFGSLTYLVPAFLIIVAVFQALDKLNKKVKAKICLSAVVGVLTLGVIDIFSTKYPLVTFFEHIAEAYKSGARSGGFVGAVVGHPIEAGFGKTGAAITFLILIFVL